VAVPPYKDVCIFLKNDLEFTRDPGHIPLFLPEFDSNSLRAGPVSCLLKLNRALLRYTLPTLFNKNPFKIEWNQHVWPVWNVAYLLAAFSILLVFMIKVYSMRLADLEYREGLGSVSAVPLRHTLLVLRRSKSTILLNKPGNNRQSRRQDQDKSNLVLESEEYENHKSAEDGCDDIHEAGHV
jgi:hypothetical protein